MKATPRRLPIWLRSALLRRAAASPGAEVCGLIGARDQQPVSHYPIANVAPTPATRFLMDPAGQIAALRAMRETDEVLWAIYHSHPEGAPVPSAVDLREAAYPEALYLIIGLQAEPTIGGFFIQDGRAVEVPLE